MSNRMSGGRCRQMKVLVYGAGVIGGQIAHALSKSGNEVTVLARGEWAETLRRKGLRIHHFIQKTDTTDHPHVITQLNDQAYDAVFAVMQYRQMERILPDLAKVNSPVVVLTGNNLSVDEMEKTILRDSNGSKTVLFGFGSTAGVRRNGILTAVHTGDGKLTIGKAHEDMPENLKMRIRQLFSGSRMSVSFCDNMDAWLKYHAAFILPVVHLSYKTGCDLKKASRAERSLVLDAAKDAYHLLMELGYPVRPKGDEKTLEPGLLRALASLILALAAKTEIGALCTVEHCRSACGEMEDLDTAFEKIRARRPDFPMPDYDRLRHSMPAWKTIREEYGKK